MHNQIKLFACFTLLLNRPSAQNSTTAAHLFLVPFRTVDITKNLFSEGRQVLIRFDFMVTRGKMILIFFLNWSLTFLSACLLKPELTRLFQSKERIGEHTWIPPARKRQKKIAVKFVAIWKLVTRCHHSPCVISGRKKKIRLNSQTKNTVFTI